MKFQIEKSEMIKKITDVESIVTSSKLQNEVTSNILVIVSDNQCTLSATNLDTGMSSIFPVDEIESGEICLPQKKLSESVRAFKGDIILFTLDGTNMILTDATKKSRSKITILGIETDQFPTMETMGDDGHEIETDTLKHVIDKTYFSIAENDARYVFNGVFIQTDDEIVTATSTDGRRLSKCIAYLENNDFSHEGIIIPTASIKEIKKILDQDSTCQILQKDKKLFIKSKGVSFFTLLIDGVFPNASEVIPSCPQYELKLDKRELQLSINQVSVMAADPTKEIKMVLSENLLEIESTLPGKGNSKDSMETEWQGPDFEINFNSNFLTDILKVIGSETVTIKLTDDKSPIVFLDDTDEGFLSLVMPIRR